MPSNNRVRNPGTGEPFSVYEQNKVMIKVMLQKNKSIDLKIIGRRIELM